MSDAGDDVQVDAASAAQQEVEVVAEVPKGKMSVEDALQVRGSLPMWCVVWLTTNLTV